MKFVTGFYLMISAGCLTLGLIYLRFWLTERMRRDYLAFVFICLSVTFFSWIELAMMKASTPEEYLFLARTSHLPSAGAVISIAWFAHLALGGRRWLFWSICGVRLLTLTLNFIFPHGINFREILSVEQTVIFGESLSYPIGVPNPWTLLASSSFVLLIIYTLDASRSAWARGEYYAVALVGSGTSFFAIVALLSPLLVISGMISLPFFSTPSIILLIAIMLSKINYDLRQSARLSGQLRVKEHELSEMLEMFNLSTEAANVGMWMKNAGDRSFWVSSKTRELFDLYDSKTPTFQQLVGKLHPGDRQQFLESLKMAETHHREFHIQSRILHDGGQIRWIDSRGKPEFNHGKPKLIYGASIDITERKLAEESFLEQEELLRELINNLPNGSVTILDREFRFLLAEGNELEKRGFSRAAMTGKLLTELFPNDVTDYVQPFYIRAFAGETVVFELKIVGEIYKITAVPLHNQNDYIYATLVLAQNITEVKQKEEQFQQLSARLLNLQDEERRRLARELHDDLSQRVALLSIDLAELREDIKAGDLQKKFDSLASQIQLFAVDIHRISHAIHPSKLSHIGLAAALRAFCREMSEHYPIEIEFIENNELPQFLNEDVSLCLYRITQEAVQNAVKHSGASCIKVSIISEDGEIRLLISDDGCGFDTETVKKKGTLGLISIKERIRAVDGTIKIKSKIGAGTIIEARVIQPGFQP